MGEVMKTCEASRKPTVEITLSIMANAVDPWAADEYYCEGASMLGFLGYARID